MDDELLEPIDGYLKSYKEKNSKNIEEFFNDLVKKSKINKEENIETVKEYRKKCAEIEDLASRISSYKSLKGFLIFLIVVSFAVAFIFILLAFSQGTKLGIRIPIFIVGVLLGVGGIILIAKKIKPAINNISEQKAKLEKEAKALLSKAWKQMAPLNALYDWGMTEQIFSKTVPLIQMDKYFDIKKYEYLHDKYGYSYSNYDNVSTYICQSGSILGNPFLICTDYCQYFRDHTYSGSITIHWTETYRDSQGNLRTVHKSEVLTAYVTEPEPYYTYEKYLVYGNEAAPELCFSRRPSKANSMDDKQIERFVNKTSKKLDKQERKAIKEGTNFTRLGNDEFEALFGGNNRNNEIQFRLLFTPLAQKNILKLIRDREIYGDDFTFIKNNKVNTIKSIHSQNMDYFTTPNRYVTYDYEEAEYKFKTYNENFFKSVYFDLAPLMSIPLYQQHKTIDFIYDKIPKTNVSHYEHESIANSFDKSYLRPDDADTPIILKTFFKNKVNNADVVKVVSHSFNAQKRVSYISKYGGDGYWHQVPVYWIEYVPVECERSMMIEVKNSSRIEYNNISCTNEFENSLKGFSKPDYCLFERGLLAALLTGSLTEDKLACLNKYYVGKDIVDVDDNALKNTIEKINLALEKGDKDEAVKNIEDILNNDKIEAVEKEYKEVEKESSNEEVNSEDDDDDDDDFDSEDNE